MSQGNESRVDMTTGAITPKLVSLAWPLVVGNLLHEEGCDALERTVEGARAAGGRPE